MGVFGRMSPEGQQRWQQFRESNIGQGLQRMRERLMERSPAIGALFGTIGSAIGYAASRTRSRSASADLLGRE